MKYVQIILWALLGCLVFYLNFGDPKFEIVTFSLLVVYLFITFKWIGRILDIRRIKKKMYTEKMRDLKEDFSQYEFTRAQPPSSLSFTHIDARKVPDAAIQSREKAIRNALQVFDYSSWLSLIAAAGYLLVHYTLSFDDLDASFLTGYYLIVSTVLSHLVYRKGDLIAHSGNLKDFGKAVIRAIPQIAFVSPAYRFWTLMFLFAYCLVEAIEDLGFIGDYGIGLIAVVILHGILLVRFHVRTRNKRNHKLLILRVFGINESAKFTFDKLQRYWKHFGSLFTVVDPTFMRNRYQDSNYNLIIQVPLIIVGLFLLWFPLQDQGIDLASYGGTFMYSALAVSLLLGILYLRYRLRKIDQSFLRSREDLNHRLAQLDKWPRKLDQSFKQLPLMCYANTWFIAVTEFILQSKVILMDLRGLSEEKTGCETEIRYLLDTVPLEQLLFLANDSDIGLVEGVIQKNWGELNERSPNLALKEPRVRVFISSKEYLEDVQGLMDMLLGISDAKSDQNQSHRE